jgi:hypothetical protein
VPHYPSKLAREGRIRNLVPNFGIEDRGDGGGVVGLVSKPEAPVRPASDRRGGRPGWAGSLRLAAG